jgi:hypothetical protein
MGDSDSEVEFNMGQGDIANVGDSPSRQVRYRDDDVGRIYQDPEHCCRNTRPAITIKPDKYSGEDDWEQYISHFQDCAELGKWNDQEKLLTLAACLRGQARAFYTTLTRPDKASFRDLARALEQRFGSARQQTRWVSKFQTRLKLVGESIAAYGDDLRLLARKAYCNLEQEAQETLALQQFCKALSVEMKCRVMDKDCRTIAEAVEVVERYEDLLNESHYERRRNFVRQVDSTEVEREVTRRDDYGKRMVRWQDRNNERSDDGIQRALRSIQIRLDRIERGSQRRERDGPRKCYICQGLDHLARACPNRYIAGNGRDSSQNGNSQAGNGEPSTL